MIRPLNLFKRNWLRGDQTTQPLQMELAAWWSDHSTSSKETGWVVIRTLNLFKRNWLRGELWGTLILCGFRFQLCETLWCESVSKQTTTVTWKKQGRMNGKKDSESLTVSGFNSVQSNWDGNSHRETLTKCILFTAAGTELNSTVTTLHKFSNSSPSNTYIDKGSW